MTGLGEAMLQMALVSRLGNTAHALRSVAMLAAVRRAGGHSDRSRFDREVGGIVPLWLQERASALKLRNLRSDVFLCFAKLLGDVPGAFPSNGQQRRQVRPKKSNRKKMRTKASLSPKMRGRKASYGMPIPQGNSGGGPHPAVGFCSA